MPCDIEGGHGAVYFDGSVSLKLVPRTRLDHFDQKGGAELSVASVIHLIASIGASYD